MTDLRPFKRLKMTSVQGVIIDTLKSLEQQTMIIFAENEKKEGLLQDTKRIYRLNANVPLISDNYFDRGLSENLFPCEKNNCHSTANKKVLVCSKLISTVYLCQKCNDNEDDRCKFCYRYKNILKQSDLGNDCEWKICHLCNSEFREDRNSFQKVGGYILNLGRLWCVFCRTKVTEILESVLILDLSKIIVEYVNGPNNFSLQKGRLDIFFNGLETNYAVNWI